MFLLRAATAAVEKTIRPHLKPWSLRHYTLMCILTTNAQDQKCIAADLGVSESAVVFFLDQLAKVGLVERQVGQDRRRKIATLTEEGQKELARMNDAVMIAQSHIAANFPRSEWDTLLAVLTELAFGKK